MLYIYTENLFALNRAKGFVKKLLGRKNRGPYALYESLVSGLSELGEPFSINRKTSTPIEVACVLSGVKTLEWALGQKKIGQIKKIIAGPNIALPWEYDGIIFDKNIDTFLVPAPWVKNYCMTFKAADKDKIKIWAAGVKTLPLPQNQTKRDIYIIFYKTISEEKYRLVEEALKNKGIKYVTLRYGNFSHSQYLELLKKAKGLIYLTASESQGLALNEAWMMDVSTFVWSGGHMKVGSHEWPYSSPAPYLTEACGMFFNELSNFSEQLDRFLSQHFSPRQYHLENFTNKIAAKKYLEIVNS